MTTITVSPSASNHDAWETGPGVIDLTGDVKIAAGTNWGGLFLPSVTVPKSPTTLTATLYYKATVTSHDSPGHTWYAQAADNASVFTTTTNDIENRPRTTASVDDTATDIGNTNWRSINITTLISEVVNRTGWVSGNNIALIADGGAGDVWIRSYDNGGDVWYVVIDYTTASPTTVTLNTLSATAAVVGLAAVTPGAVALLLDTLSAALTGAQLAVAPGGVSQLLDTLSGALAAEALGVAPGGVALLMSTLSATGAPGALVVAPGAAAVALSTLSAGLEAVDLTVAPGAVAILLDTHTATLAAVSLTVEGAANIVILNTLSGALTAVSLTVTPGEYVAALNTLIALLQVMDLTVGQGLLLNTLSAAVSAEPLTVVPGEYVAALATLAPSLQAVGLAVVPGAVSIDLDTLTALLLTIAIDITGAGSDATVLLSTLAGALSAVEIGVIPGDMAIELQTLAGALTLDDLLVYLLLGCVLVGNRGTSAAVTGDYAPLLIQTGDKGGCR